MTTFEWNLFDAFENGDIQVVKEILQKQEINLNCQDDEVFFFSFLSFSLFFEFDLIC